VFQALAKGYSTIDGREPSLHTKTARWVAEQLSNVKFDSNGHCEGIGIQIGNDKSSNIDTLTAEIAQLEV
jgi:RNA 3'-terminal phosphate cyclase (ATP)